MRSKKKSTPVEKSDSETDNRIDISGSGKLMLNYFLKSRPHWKISETSNTDCVTLSDLNCDENEVWMVQCPSNIDINQLYKSKLTLSEGHSVFPAYNGEKHFECNSELLNCEKHLTVICPTSGASKACSFKQTGFISIRERIDLPNKKVHHHNTSLSNNDVVQYPENLTIRHPLFGANYDEVTIKSEPNGQKKKKKNKEKKRQSQDLTAERKIKTEIESPEKLKMKQKLRTVNSDYEEQPKKKKSRKE